MDSVDQVDFGVLACHFGPPPAIVVSHYSAQQSQDLVFPLEENLEPPEIGSSSECEELYRSDSCAFSSRESSLDRESATRVGSADVQDRSSAVVDSRRGSGGESAQDTPAITNFDSRPSPLCASLRSDGDGFAGDLSLFQRRRRLVSREQLLMADPHHRSSVKEERRGRSLLRVRASSPRTNTQIHDSKGSPADSLRPRSLFPPIDQQQFGQDALPLVPDFSIEANPAVDASSKNTSRSS
jgi:hypothetical protein